MFCIRWAFLNGGTSVINRYLSQNISRFQKKWYVLYLIYNFILQSYKETSGHPCLEWKSLYAPRKNIQYLFWSPSNSSNSNTYVPQNKTTRQKTYLMRGSNCIIISLRWEERMPQTRHLHIPKEEGWVDFWRILRFLFEFSFRKSLNQITTA